MTAIIITPFLPDALRRDNSRYDGIMLLEQSRTALQAHADATAADNAQLSRDLLQLRSELAAMAHS